MWIAPKLNTRVRILNPNQTPNAKGGADLDFGIAFSKAFAEMAFDREAALVTVWMSFQPIVLVGRGNQYVRGQQTNRDMPTHVFQCRKIAVSHLGRAFDSSFSNSFDSVPDFNPLKSTYFLQIEAPNRYLGRLFRIESVTDVKEQNEILKIKAIEYEERGTGWPR